MPCYSRLSASIGIQLRGAHRRIQAEEQADDGGDADAQRRPTTPDRAGSGESLR